MRDVYPGSVQQNDPEPKRYNRRVVVGSFIGATLASRETVWSLVGRSGYDVPTAKAGETNAEEPSSSGEISAVESGSAREPSLNFSMLRSLERQDLYEGEEHLSPAVIQDAIEAYENGSKAELSDLLRTTPGEVSTNGEIDPEKASKVFCDKVMLGLRYFSTLDNLQNHFENPTTPNFVQAGTAHDIDVVREIGGYVGMPDSEVEKTFLYKVFRPAHSGILMLSYLTNKNGSPNGRFDINYKGATIDESLEYQFGNGKELRNVAMEPAFTSDLDNPAYNTVSEAGELPLIIDTTDQDIVKFWLLLDIDEQSVLEKFAAKARYTFTIQ